MPWACKWMNPANSICKCSVPTKSWRPRCFLENRSTEYFDRHSAFWKIVSKSIWPEDKLMSHKNLYSTGWTLQLSFKIIFYQKGVVQETRSGGSEDSGLLIASVMPVWGRAVSLGCRWQVGVPLVSRPCSWYVPALWHTMGLSPAADDCTRSWTGEEIFELQMHGSSSQSPVSHEHICIL